LRKDRYIKHFTKHLPFLHNLAMKSGLNYYEADEVVSKCSMNILTNKKYSAVETRKLKTFLRVALRFEVQHYKRSELQRDNTCSRLPEVDEWWMEHTVKVPHVAVLELVEERECPFCFQANLNEYGACHMCHTILPSHIRIQKSNIGYSEESLSVEFDFNTTLDVAKAVARLTPFEQRVVKAVGLGNESLESFALDINVSKTSLVRTWVEAKVKLQWYLREYAPKRVSKKDKSAFREALQSIEK